MPVSCKKENSRTIKVSMINNVGACTPAIREDKKRMPRSINLLSWEPGINWYKHCFYTRFWPVIKRWVLIGCLTGPNLAVPGYPCQFALFCVGFVVVTISKCINRREFELKGNERKKEALGKDKNDLCLRPLLRSALASRSKKNYSKQKMCLWSCT